MASRPFQFLEKKRSKIRKRAAKYFEGLAALSTHSAGRRAAVKVGCKPVHFSLDGCPLSCYFSGSVATLRDTLSTSQSAGRRTGAFIYALSAVDRAYNTLHFALQSRVPNGGVAPFGNPHKKRRYKPPQEKAVRYPSTGRIPPFLVIQPSGCIG